MYLCYFYTAEGSSILCVQNEVCLCLDGVPVCLRLSQYAPGILAELLIASPFTHKGPGLDEKVFATAFLKLISSSCAFEII